MNRGRMFHHEEAQIRTARYEGCLFCREITICFFEDTTAMTILRDWRVTKA